MEFIFCPTCFGSDFTEDFNCRECQEAILNGGVQTNEQKKRQLKIREKSVSVSNKKIVQRTFKQKIFIASFSFLVVLCSAAFIYQVLLAGKTKSLITINSQLSARNEQNKMAIETNEQKSLTTITLTQEKVGITNENQPVGSVKLLFDTIFEGNILTQTPADYHLTIISTNQKDLSLNSAKFELKTETGAFDPVKQTSHHWNIGNDSHEYVSFEISRKDLEKIAFSKQISFQIGEFRGQMNFAQQQSLKSFLIATSLESKIQ